MTVIDEEPRRNIQKSDSVEDFRILFDSVFWLYISPDIRKNILNLLAEQPDVDTQQQLPFN